MELNEGLTCIEDVAGECRDVIRLMGVLQEASNEDYNMVDAKFFYCLGGTDPTQDVLFGSLDMPGAVSIPDIRIKFELLSNNLGYLVHMSCNSRYGAINRRRMDGICFAHKCNFLQIDSATHDGWLVINEMYLKKNLCIKVSDLIKCNDTYIITPHRFFVVESPHSRIELIMKY